MEIIVKGNNLFDGYIKNKKKTNQILRNKWLHTGDLGKIDERGNLYIQERTDNMIIVSGENIFPTEIEKFVNNHRKIKLSVVVPVKDEISQNKLVLIYESKSKVSEEEILNYLTKKFQYIKFENCTYCKKLGLKVEASIDKILETNYKFYKYFI